MIDWDFNGIIVFTAIFPFFIFAARQRVKKQGYLRKRSYKGIATGKLRKRMRQADIFIAGFAMVYLTIYLLFSWKVLSLRVGEEQRFVDDLARLARVWVFWFPVLGLQAPMLSFFEVRLTNVKRLFLGVWSLVPLAMSIFVALVTGESQLVRGGLVSSFILLLICGPAIVCGKDFLRIYSRLWTKIVMIGLDRKQYRVYGAADE